MSKKNSGGKPALEIPKEIRMLAEGFRRQRAIKERAAIQRKQKMDAGKKRVQAGRLKRGWEVATKIFLWATALRESDVGQELIKKTYSLSLIFFDDDIVGMPKENLVRLAISPNGMFLVYTNHRQSQQYVPSSKYLAEEVYTTLLKAAGDSIDNGAVWDCIKRRLDQSEK